MPDQSWSLGFAPVLAIDWESLSSRAWPFLIIIVASLTLRFFLPPVRSHRQALIAELLVLLPAVLLYFVTRGQVDARAADAIRHAEQIIALEQRLGIFVEVELQRLLLESSTATTIMNWIYIWMHWPVVAGTVIWLVTTRPRETFAVYRNAFLLSGAIGMTVFALYPVAPPRLMPDLEFADTVTMHSRSYRVLQPPALTNPYAAMPSLHLGWNLLVGIAIVREARHPAGRVFGVLMPVLMFCAIVLTGNHYILDGVAGGALTIACLLVALRLSRHRPDRFTWRGITRREEA